MGTVGRPAARPLSFAERMLADHRRAADDSWGRGAVRRLAGLRVVSEQIPAGFRARPETIDALYDALVSGPLIERTLTSMRTLA